MWEGGCTRREHSKEGRMHTLFSPIIALQGPLNQMHLCFVKPVSLLLSVYRRYWHQGCLYWTEYMATPYFPLIRPKTLVSWYFSHPFITYTQSLRKSWWLYTLNPSIIFLLLSPGPLQAWTKPQLMELVLCWRLFFFSWFSDPENDGPRTRIPFRTVSKNDWSYSIKTNAFQLYLAKPVVKELLHIWIHLSTFLFWIIFFCCHLEDAFFI